MNSVPALRKSFLALTLLALLGAGAPVLANHGLFETTYASVAETSYAIPTSYVVPTSYAMPTSYLMPTSYVSTSSIAYPTSTIYPTSSTLYPTAYTSASYVATPTSYLVPTTYYSARRSLLFPRRYVARPLYSTAYYAAAPTTYYAPTAYYTPTVYATSVYPTVIEAPLVASSTACCGESAPVMSTPAIETPRAPSRVESNERAPSSVVESVPANEPAYRPEASPNATRPEPPPEPAPVPAPAPVQLDPGTPTPPIAPAPERETTTVPAPPLRSQAPGNESNPPTASAGTGFIPEPAPTSLRREAQKPVAPTTIRPQLASNVLAGKVVSSDSREGEEGVRVIITSRPGSFVDRVATTDAFGRYAVRLPDGDWTVKVAMPSGRVYAVSQITISGGQITDNYGRDIPSLTITR